MRACPVGPNDEGHRANGAPETHANQRVNFASDGTVGKALATMQERAAQCGCTLHELADGAYLVGGRGDSTTAPCLRAVGNLLRQIGGR